MRKTFTGLIGIVLAALAASGASAQETGDKAAGRKLFMDDGCYQCHGTTGHGGGNAGPRITPPAPLPGLINQLRRPNRMPPYPENVISDAQIADIHAYLASIPPGKPLAQIPLLDSIR